MGCTYKWRMKKKKKKKISRAHLLWPWKQIIYKASEQKKVMKEKYVNKNNSNDNNYEGITRLDTLLLFSYIVRIRRINILTQLYYTHTCTHCRRMYRLINKFLTTNVFKKAHLHVY